MRKKLISNTYLRDVNKYILKIMYEDEYYCVVKKIIEVKEPFVLLTGLCLIDDGYYIMEVIPKNENYCIRIFFDSNKKILEYYIDISLENGLDEKTKIPYYVDLFIDITIINDEVEILDEDELMDALFKEQITFNDYILACNIKDRLLSEINNHTNKYINMNLADML